MRRHPEKCAGDKLRSWMDTEGAEGWEEGKSLGGRRTEAEDEDEDEGEWGMSDHRLIWGTYRVNVGRDVVRKG